MEKLSRREKIMYGMGDLSGNIMFAAISFYLLYFFINVVGINPFNASIIFIVARGWDAISDYLMGRIVDKTHSKWGRRKVYLLFGALPFGMAFILLWWNPFGIEASQLVKTIYFIGAYLIFNTTWTIVYIPYNALTVNMTKDYDERTSLNGYRIVMANIGILLGAAVFSLLCEGTESILFGVFGSVEKAYAVSGIIFGTLAFIIMLLCALNVKERYEDVTENDKGFFQTLKEFFSLKEFRNISAYYLLSMIGFDIIMSLFIFLINDALGFAGGAEAMIFVAIPLVVAIASSFFWVKLSEKYEKHKVYLVAVIEISLALITVLFLPEKNYITTGLMCAAAGFGMSAIQILPFASLPDVCEVDELVYGKRREGAYYGLTQFMYKLASGVAVGVASYILGAFGYVESTGGEIIAQPASALLAIRVVLAVIPSVIFFISVIFAYRSHLSRERFNQIKKELAIRKENENK